MTPERLAEIRYQLGDLSGENEVMVDELEALRVARDYAREMARSGTKRTLREYASATRALILELAGEP